MPTAVQAIKAVILCQALSTGFQQIDLFRYDPITKQIYIIAGVSGAIEVIIYEDGNWEFNRDEQA